MSEKLARVTRERDELVLALLDVHRGYAERYEEVEPDDLGYDYDERYSLDGLDDDLVVDEIVVDDARYGDTEGPFEAPQPLGELSGLAQLRKHLRSNEIDAALDARGEALNEALRVARDAFRAEPTQVNREARKAAKRAISAFAAQRESLRERWNDELCACKPFVTQCSWCGIGV